MPKFNDRRPSIDNFEPKQGLPNEIVTIYGRKLKNCDVFFGGAKAEIIYSEDDGIYVNVKVPKGATYAPITVVKQGVSLMAQSFVYFTPKSSLVKPNIGINYSKLTTNLIAGTAPSNMALGDFDHDGKTDLVISNDATESISIYRNTTIAFGEAGYTGQTTYELVGVPLIVGLNPQGITVGDINGDGKLDIAVACYNGTTVVLYINNTTSGGSISFTKAPDLGSGSCPFSIVIADMDSDGRADLVVANKDSNSIYVFRNTGSYDIVDFDPYFEIRTGDQPYSLTTGDMDGDGKLDIIIAPYAGGGLLIYRNISLIGGFEFEPALELAVNKAYNVTLADLDQDGKMDIISGNMDFGLGHSFSILRNISEPGDITFDTKQDYSITNRTYSIAIGDLDGDGKVDLAVAGYSNTIGASTIGFYRNTSSTGSISLNFDGNITSSNGPTALKIFDVDGDGTNDIVEVNNIDETLNVLKDASTLPVSLNSFTAKLLKNGQAQLSWATAAEQNNSHFNIYRSNDGQHFDVLKSVKGNGTTSAKNTYTFIDARPLAGTNYYKLQQVDFNGSQTDLGIKALHVNISVSPVLAYPNPFATLLNVSFEAGQYTKIELLDLSGKILKSNIVDAVAKQSSFEVANLASGSYIVKLVGANNSVSKIVIKK